MTYLTTAEALKLRQREFKAPRPCKTCGSHDRVLLQWSSSYVSCVGCEVNATLSATKIRVALNQRNKVVKKLLAKPGPLPVVFSGMNTI